MYVPPLARSNAGFMRQEGSNNQGFASRKSSPTLLSMTRAAENGSSGTRTRNKGSNVTTGYEGIKKPTSSALIYPVKGNQTLDGYFEYMEEKALTCKIVNKLVKLQYWSVLLIKLVSLVQKLSSITGYHRGKMTTPSARFRSL